jgi:hypothetical protein
MPNFLDSWNKKTQTWNAKEEFNAQAGAKDCNEVSNSI